MNRYVVLPRARTDLIDIWNYSAEQWGVPQADRYIRDIDAVIEAVADGSQRGRSCNEIRAGYSKIAIGSHVIFYYATRTKISIVRVLHQRQDFPRHL
jgi:toxin ParE1/3/4